MTLLERVSAHLAASHVRHAVIGAAALAAAAIAAQVEGALQSLPASMRHAWASLR